MGKYQSGQKIVQERIDALRREINALKSTTPAYNVEQGRTYGRGLAALRDAYAQGKAGLQPLFVKADGSSIARPLTFEETIDAIVNDYESGNKDLIARQKDSCTGILCKAGTSRFKVVPASRHLILLGEDFSSLVVSADYNSRDGTELDKSKGKYDVQLTKPEVLENLGWLTAVRDKSLLRAFRDIVFAERGTKTAMSFAVTNNPHEDELRALTVDHIGGGSSANGWNYLSDSASFVRVSPK